MRVLDLRREPTGAGSRVTARVEWEDARRPPTSLSYAADPPFDRDLAPASEAFLTALAWPAFRAGERRIAVEGRACPRLRDGLETTLRTLARWYRLPGRPPAIEPASGFSARPPPASPRTVAFLSGGVDSLDLLLSNRATFPRDHPLSIRDALFVHGLDVGAPRQEPRLRFFDRARALLDDAARSVGATLVVARTDVRGVDPDGWSWPNAWFGAATVSVAHAFAGWSVAMLAASLDVEGLSSVGSHPMLDPYLSSGALDVRHEGVHRSRLDKIRAVAAWPEGLRALRVCWQEIPEDGPLNCGRCRKCVRAMLGLLSVGRLADAPTFPRRDLTAADMALCTVDRHTARFYGELLDPLDRAGRRDLSDALRRNLAAFRGASSSWRARWRRLRRAWRADGVG